MNSEELAVAATGWYEPVMFCISYQLEKKLFIANISPVG